MRIRAFDVGLESITRLQPEDEVHLPESGALPQMFLPETRPLDAILRRPSLDERLPELLAPLSLDPELLNPSVLTATRLAMQTFFGHHAEREERAGARNIFSAATALLENDTALDHEVRSALAALLRG
ncbi:MAG: hypothetical protein ACR652_13620 [Methylocystis sp.]|uniref:type III secretion apparatus assembly protein SctX n=1 Tax=Methylocystis sp. TaxID=1911079 RepID=UPI003DA2AD84